MGKGAVGKIAVGELALGECGGWECADVERRHKRTVAVHKRVRQPRRGHACSFLNGALVAWLFLIPGLRQLQKVPLPLRTCGPYFASTALSETKVLVPAHISASSCGDVGSETTTLATKEGIAPLGASGHVVGS